jgi:AraC-like DNA-binding protein
MSEETFFEGVKEYLHLSGHTLSELADKLGVSREHLNRMFDRKEQALPGDLLNIIFTLADWSAFSSITEVQRLLDFTQIPVSNEMLPDFKEILTLPASRIIHIRIEEQPLTAQNLSIIISALTELSTKYWLIAKGRFADLIEYTQTHNSRFAEEAQVIIAKISYNSPFSMDWKVDLSAPSVAEALVITIDGITQRRERLEKAKLENQTKAQEIKEAEQKAEQENQAARLELEQRRLEVLEKELEIQKKGIEYALEIAQKVVDTLHPGADPATRAMEIQVYLPNIIQLQNGKGVRLPLPIPPSDHE